MADSRHNAPPSNVPTPPNAAPGGGRDEIETTDASGAHYKGGKRVPQSGDKDYDPTTRPGYQEYPKMVTPTHGGPDVLVHSKEEEDEINAAKPADPTKPPVK